MASFNVSILFETPPEKLLIISPFCSDAVLKKLASSSKTCFLLTREEELLALKPATLKAFDQEIYTLADGLVDDDYTNDDQSNNFQVKTDQILTKGLHAKAYIYDVLEDGKSKTHVVVGSANATDAALTCQKNDEILVELVSEDSELINVDHFLSSMKANGYLTQYDDLSAIGDSSLSEDNKLLEEIRKWICSTTIRGYCTFDETSNYWNYVLNAEGMNTQNNYQDYEIKVWPITLDEKRAQSWNISKTNENIVFSNLTSTAISSLIAFEIKHKLQQEQVRFVLKITVSDLPSDRDAEILRTLINNKEGFLQYLRILLGYVYATDKIGTKNSEADFNWLNRLLEDETTLFEDLFVIYMKEPERLQDIQKLVQDLGGEGSAHIPKEFIQLWHAFEQVIKGKK